MPCVQKVILFLTSMTFRHAGFGGRNTMERLPITAHSSVHLLNPKNYLLCLNPTYIISFFVNEYAPLFPTHSGSRPERASTMSCPSSASITDAIPIIDVVGRGLTSTI